MKRRIVKLNKWLSADDYDKDNPDKYIISSVRIMMVSWLTVITLTVLIFKLF